MSAARAAAGDPPSPPEKPGEETSPDPTGETGWTGTADDVASLRRWLVSNGVDVDAFGGDGAKSLVDLAVEVERGETTLVLDPRTRAPRRDVRVLRLLVTDEDRRPGMVLIEARQEWQSGRSRERRTPLSEKLLRDEDWRVACTRAVDEELGSAVDVATFAMRVDETSVRESFVDRDSLSYPGLRSRYAMYTATCDVKGLPEPTEPVLGSASGEMGFTSMEDTPSGWLKATWTWRRREEVEGET